MKPNGFGGPLTIDQAPPAGQSFNVSSELSVGEMSAHASKSHRLLVLLVIISEMVFFPGCCSNTVVQSYSSHLSLLIWKCHHLHLTAGYFVVDAHS